MRFAVSPLPRCLGFWAVDRSSFLSCRLAVSEIRSVQAKLCHHVVKAVGLFLACANPLQHCSAHVGVLQVIDAGLDELPQVVALRAARGLRELIQPRSGRWVQPDGHGHPALDRCIRSNWERPDGSGHDGFMLLRSRAKALMQHVPNL